MSGMKRNTAFKIAIEAMEDKRRRVYSFDYHIGIYYPAAVNENATKHYLRITEAIETLEAERDHQQLDLFGASE